MSLLISGDWSGLELLSRGVRLSASDFSSAVARDRLNFVAPPTGWQSKVHVIRTRDPGGQVYAVAMPLWEAGDEMSDYTLELTIKNPGATDEVVEVDDFHVM